MSNNIDIDFSDDSDSDIGVDSDLEFAGGIGLYDWDDFNGNISISQLTKYLKCKLQVQSYSQ